MAPPSDSDWSMALSAIQLTYIPSGGTCAGPAPSDAKTATNVIIIVISVVGGVAVLLFAAVLYMYLSATSAGPVLPSPTMAPQPVRSTPNFSGRGLYNPPHKFGTTRQGRGVYVSRLEMPAW